MDKKAYLFVYDNRFGERETITAYLDKNPDILLWRFDLPNSYYLISFKTAEELTDMIRKEYSVGRFIITEIGENRNGFLTQESWYMIQNKAQKRQ